MCGGKRFPAFFIGFTVFSGVGIMRMKEYSKIEQLTAIIRNALFDKNVETLELYPIAI